MTEIGQFSAAAVQGHERFGRRKQPPVAAQTCPLRRAATNPAARRHRSNRYGADHVPHSDAPAHYPAAEGVGNRRSHVFVV